MVEPYGDMTVNYSKWSLKIEPLPVSFCLFQSFLPVGFEPTALQSLVREGADCCQAKKTFFRRPIV